MKNIFYILIFVISLPANAEYSWQGFGSYGPWDTWLPGKIGVIGAYGEKQVRTYELAIEQATYSFDIFFDSLGAITDRRIHLTTRSHTYTNSFNFQYGISYNSFTASLGKGFVGVDVASISNLALVWGLGNRFVVNDKWSFGVDWFKIFMPIFVLNKEDGALNHATDKSSKDDLQDLFDTVGKLPTFSILHLELGYSF